MTILEKEVCNNEVKQSCIDILRDVPNPVSILTLWLDDRPWGVTVSSFIPVTMDPPKIMVSLFGHTLAAKAILSRGKFGVSVLDPTHQSIAEKVAVPGQPKFIDDSVEYSEKHTDSPQIRGASHFSCNLDDFFVVDDHVLLIGKVVSAKSGQSRDKLLYANRTFIASEMIQRTENI